MTTPTPTTKQTCRALRADKTPCRAYAIRGSLFCLMHDPQRATEATAARRAGGKARGKPAPAEPIRLRTIDDQIAAIELTIDRVRAGREPVNVARLALYGISLARPLIELGEIEGRLSALESHNNAVLQPTHNTDG